VLIFNKFLFSPTPSACRLGGRFTEKTLLGMIHYQLVFEFHIWAPERPVLGRAPLSASRFV